MVIGSVAGMAKKSLGEMAFLAVAIMAVGNAAGASSPGLLSDRIGRGRTLFVMLACQAVMMFAAIPIVGVEDDEPGPAGAPRDLHRLQLRHESLALPLLPKDLWGLKNFGTNYGVLFSAWGVGGLVLPRLSQTLVKSAGEVPGKYTNSFAIAGILLLAAAVLTLTVRRKPAAD